MTSEEKTAFWVSLAKYTMQGLAGGAILAGWYNLVLKGFVPASSWVNVVSVMLTGILAHQAGYNAAGGKKS